MRGPPNPECERAAPAGSPNRKTNKSLADIQASRLSCLYALSLSTASTIAALAYGAVR